MAHIDRMDPRRDPLGHLKKDVRVPYTAMGAVSGACLGAAIGKSKKATATGALIGALAGIALDIASHNSTKLNQGI